MVQERNPQGQRNPTALFIAQSLVHPTDEQLPDVSNISIRMAHPLTMLKSLIEQMDVFIKQIQERQKWQVKRYVRQQVLMEQRQISYYKTLRDKQKTEEEKNKIVIPSSIWTDEYQFEFITKAESSIKLNDKFDKMDMFAMDFFLTYCHISRGKEFKLADSMQVLADSEITNRNPEDERDMSPPIKG